MTLIITQDAAHWVTTRLSEANSNYPHFATKNGGLSLRNGVIEFANWQNMVIGHAPVTPADKALWGRQSTDYYSADGRLVFTCGFADNLTLLCFHGTFYQLSMWVFDAPRHKLLFGDPALEYLPVRYQAGVEVVETSGHDIAWWQTTHDVGK